MADFGYTGATGASTDIALTNAYFIELDNAPEDGDVVSLSHYIVTSFGAVRAALYAGGSAGNPDGASLVWDAGAITPSSGALATWSTSPSGSFTSGQKLWLAFKSNQGSFGGYGGSDPGGNDMTGVLRYNTGISNDDAVAYDATHSGTGSLFTAYFRGTFLTYTAAAAPSSTVGAGANRGLVNRGSLINGRSLIRTAFSKAGDLFVPDRTIYRPRLVPVGIAL